MDLTIRPRADRPPEAGEAGALPPLALPSRRLLLLGVGTILWWGPELGVMAAALGYLVGCLVSSLGPLVIVWIHDRMSWTGLMLRVVAGYALVLLGLWFEKDHASLASHVLVTVSFLAAWCALSWRDLAPRVTQLRRRTRRS